MADWVVVVGLCILIVIFLLWLTPRSSIPGPTAVPILGNLLVLWRAKPGEHYVVYKQLAKQYGDMFRLYFGRQLVVRLNTYDIIHEAFVQKAHVFSGRQDFLQNHGKGLLCGDDHKRIRPFFGSKLMTLDGAVSDNLSYEEKILQEIEVLAEHLSVLSDQPIKINKLLYAASGNIILDILFGVRKDYEDNEFKEMLEAEENCSRLSPPVSILGLLFPILKPILPRVKMNIDVSIVHKYTEKMIKQSRDNFDEKNIRCYFDTIIQAERKGEISGDMFSDDDIFYTVFDMFFSAVGGVGVGLCWCIVYMIRYPEIQKKCRDEIRKVTGMQRKVRLSDREKLNFTQATVYEIQRIAASAAITVPHVATQDGQLRGHQIPKGTVLIGDIWVANTLNTRNGDKFTPERFLDGKGEIARNDQNLVYGIGPRKCLGDFIVDMEIFLLFSNLLQQFTFTKASPSDDFDFRGYFGLLMTTPDYEVRVEKYKSQ